MKRRTIPVNEDGELRALVHAALGDAVDALIGAGAVYVNGRRVMAARARVSAGQTVTVVLEEGGVLATAPSVSAPALEVLFEDDAVLAVNKPAGVTAQPTPSRVGDSLVDLVAAQLGRAPGLVHRLDKETSGVTLFGKTADATSALAAAFREGQVKKRYVAITAAGLPREGIIDLPLSKDPSRPGRWRATSFANGVPALTRFELLHDGAFCIVSLSPQTGRTHQLRAHLTAQGHPIAGDSRYGGPEVLDGLPCERCLLHAESLALPHPSRRSELVLHAPLPEDMRAFFIRAGAELPLRPK